MPNETALIRLFAQLSAPLRLLDRQRLLPAALSHGIGSDSQRPFAIVIVDGLIADLIISVILLPTLYTWFARSDDRLPEADPNEAV
jgi:hypothetical protein